MRQGKAVRAAISRPPGSIPLKPARPVGRLTGGLLTGGLLAAGLIGAAVTVAALTTGSGPVLSMAARAPMPVLFVCFVLAFAYAEVAVPQVPLRREVYSFSLSGTAMLAGLLFCDLRLIVLARVAGALLIFGYRRLPVLKVAFHLTAYVLKAVLAGSALHLLLGSSAHLNLTSAAICALVMVPVDLLVSALVLGVIAWQQDGVSRNQAVEVLILTLALSVLGTLAALTAVSLVNQGALGVCLIIGLTIVVSGLYHVDLVLRRRHRLLVLLQDFAGPEPTTGTVAELAQTLLYRARRVLQAGEIELTIRRPEFELRMRIAANGTFSSSSVPRTERWDRALTQAVENGRPILAARNPRDPALRQWLRARGAREAMIVPLQSATATGELIVIDRLGRAATFTTTDLTLMQGLAGHIVVALHGTELVQQLRHDARHDPLTGLANGVLLAERIDGELDAAGTGPIRAWTNGPAVLKINLNRFKEVNDVLGQQVGDAMLRIVASRIGNATPAEATVARLGADEFAVLLPVPSDPMVYAEERARKVADDVLNALGAPVALAEAVLTIRAGIGIAIGSPGLSGAELLRQADTAMSIAKLAGERSVAVYAEELDRGRPAQLTLLADLHFALRNDQLVMRYQPQLDLRTNRVVSVEALVRWRHPVRGLLAPDEFIPLAESSGLIEELTYQVLNKALRQCREWRDAGIDLVMAVNLSAYSVDNLNLAEDVAAALARAGLPADRLVLEITESSVMGDPLRTVPILRRLAGIGVTLSLDDFGTGYSSLAYLQRLPVSEVKIDKSFVMGMTIGGEAHASAVLVRSILNLGVNLGLRVVAEGVEDAAVLEDLRGLGCDLAQGYHIARPLPAAEIVTLMSGVLGSGVSSPLK